jgi:hypothetical protein
VRAHRALWIAAAALASSCGVSHSVDVPVDDPHARALAVGSTHSCALREAGLYCWGDNSSGQLADGTMESSEAPVLASAAGMDIAEVAVSNARTCVRRGSGAVECWGAISGVAALDDAVQLALDETTTCVLHRSGEVSCARATLELETIAGLWGIVELRGGVSDTYCARDDRDRVYCIRSEGDVWAQPVQAPALRGARAIVVSGSNEVCAIAPERNVLCHDLDNGKTVPLPESEDSVAITGTSLVACAQQRDDGWTCWNILPPMLESTGTFALHVPSELTLVELAVGGFNVCAVRDDGDVVCASAGSAMPELVVIAGLPR